MDPKMILHNPYTVAGIFLALAFIFFILAIFYL